MSANCYLYPTLEERSALFAEAGSDIILDVGTHNLQVLLKGLCSHCNVKDVDEK
jgi:hypothetical protein